MQVIIEKAKIGSWEFAISSEVVPISPAQIEWYEDWINEQWVPAFWAVTQDDSWGGKSNGMISPIIRIDGLPPLQDGSYADRPPVFEVEVQPEGLGINLEMFKRLSRTHLIDRWRHAFEDVGVTGFVNVDSPYAQDDPRAAEILGLPFSTRLSSLVAGELGWVRQEGLDVPDAVKMSSAPPQGVSSWTKQYLLPLQLAEKVSNVDDLPWEQGLVAKPLLGCRTNGVFVYLPPAQKRQEFREVEGFTRRGKIEESLQGGEPYIVQPFLPPLRKDNGMSIWRVFFVWDSTRQRYQFGGGAWNWRPNNVKVHGAKDAVFGVIDSE